MEIEDNFEEWDFLDSEELEMLFSEDDNEKDDDESDSESESENEEDDEVHELKCSKCSKIYHVVGWLKKHEVSCDGKTKKSKSTNNKKGMSQHQKHVREILSSLGFDEYYDEMCVPAILSSLQEVCGVEEATVKLRGPRFANCKLQASSLLPEVEVNSFFKDLSSKLWTICFAKDNLLRSSRRHMHIAQEIHAFRHSQSIKTSWVDLNISAGTGTDDQLILQIIITAIFGDICQYRKKSLEKELQIEVHFEGESNVNKPSLTSVERDIVCYIAGYVCRKVRDRLQRYCNTNRSSKILKVQEKCCSFELMIKSINDMILNCGANTPAAMTFPNLMTLSLTRGGLSQVNRPTFTFFCYLELSIRPFLNLTKFRSSNRVSDIELLDQLVNNSTLLKPAWPCSATLSSEASNLLIKLFTELYYRVRKWAYLKVYKEQKKYKETLASLALKSSSKQTVSLHGKDSLRKALMNNNNAVQITISSSFFQ